MASRQRVSNSRTTVSAPPRKYRWCCDISGGNLDNWDPALIEALAAGREVILVDYPGVGSSTWCADQHHSRDGAPDDRILSARSASSGSTCSGSRSVGSSRRKSC